MTRLIRILVVLMSVVGTLEAQQDTARLRWVPNPQTTAGSWVVDPSGHLRAETKARIDSIITALRNETTAEIGVAVLDTLDDLDAHTAAFTLHRRWGVGERARDNGIVLLWSPKLRETYISVGPGLEGVIPDAVAGRIQDDVIIPRFRRGDFDAGMIAGVGALAAVARGETYAGRPAERRSSARVVSTIAQSALGLFVLVGALLGWRRRPRRCPRGHGWMTKLGEKLDNSELTGEEVLEENLGSMNYHVWVCDKCDERRIIPRTRWWAGYERCPKCKAAHGEEDDEDAHRGDLYVCGVGRSHAGLQELRVHEHEARDDSPERAQHELQRRWVRWPQRRRWRRLRGRLVGRWRRGAELLSDVR